MGESGADGGASLMFFSVVCLSKTIGLVLDFLLGINMHIYIYIYMDFADKIMHAIVVRIEVDKIV